MSEKANQRKRARKRKDESSLRRQIVEPRLEESATDISATESAPQQADQRISEEARERESESAEELPYTVGWWKGFRQWKCKLCPWDTLEGEAAMLEHIATVHKPPPSPILIADKRGRVINRE